jgi:hypothetical protein
MLRQIGARKMRELPRKRNFLVVPRAFTWLRALGQCLFEERRDTLLNASVHEDAYLLAGGQLVQQRWYCVAIARPRCAVQAGELDLSPGSAAARRVAASWGDVSARSTGDGARASCADQLPLPRLRLAYGANSIGACMHQSAALQSRQPLRDGGGLAQLGTLAACQISR